MTDLVKELNQLLDRAPNALEAQNLGESLSVATRAVASADADIARLQALTAAALLLQPASDPTTRRALDDAIEAIDDLGATLERASGKQSLDGVAQYAATVQRTLRALETAVRARWATLAARDFQPLVTVGRVLSNVADTAALGKTMTKDGESILSRAATISIDKLAPFIEASYDTRRRLNEERQAILKEGDVNTFFEAVANNEATLQHLTPSVYERLAKLGALEVFTVQTKT